jgi:hypothetical protein
MKLWIAVVAAVISLSGCVAVPVAEPYPAYGPGYYYGPPATFSFGYNYYGGGGHRHHRHWR